MADHLPSGRVRNAEIAIQEEVAQTSARELGIAWLGVREFTDDSVLVHDGLHRVSGKREASRFSAGSLHRVTAVSPHARNAPATLRNGGFARVTRQTCEASGARREFGSAAFLTTVRAWSCRPESRRDWHQLMHGLPHP
jgi:hypothetical protein